MQAILPAESTRMILSNVTREDIRTFTGVFPALKDVPNFDGRLNLGVVDAGWILTSSDKTIPVPDANETYGRQTVLISDAAVTGSLTGSGERVKTTDAFRVVARGISADTPFVYLPNAARSVPAPLRPFVRSSGAVMASMKNSSVIVRAYGESMISPALRGSLSNLSPAPDVSIMAASPAKLMETFLMSLPEHERAARRTATIAALESILGGDWSFTYDVLPMLREESGVHVSLDDERALLFHGTTSDQRKIDGMLTSLHEHFRETLLGTSVTRRTLEPGFTSVILKSDPSQISDRRYALNGWTVYETRQANGSGALVSATRGRQFLFSTKPIWAEQMIARAQAEQPGSVLPSATAAGILSPSLVKTLTAETSGDPLWEWINEALGGSNVRRVWSMESDGHSLTLSLTLPQP